MVIPQWAWIAGLIGGTAAVAGVAYAASGGATKPATPAAPATTNPAAAAAAAATTAAATTVVTDSTVITASQNALALVSTKGTVPGLSYSVPATGGSGVASDPAFVAALAVFQRWQNSKGGFKPTVNATASTTTMQLNTAGTLDYLTVAALLTAASS
jgi:pyruvate/2-oxoglutarate dehydrogenase complex dihydrolipoamide acyltransferase (E2) component